MDNPNVPGSAFFTLGVFKNPNRNQIANKGALMIYEYRNNFVFARCKDKPWNRNEFMSTNR